MDKFVGARGLAFSGEVRENQLGFRINRHPNVLVAPFLSVARKEVPFLRMDEGPEFICLHESRTYVSDFRVEQGARFFANREKQGKNRALVNSRNAGDGANAHALKQERNDLSGGFRGDVVPPKRSLARSGKRGFAGRAAKTLDFIASVKPKSLRFGVPATDARHGLLFLREKLYNQGLGSDCGLRSPLDSALPVALTTGRAFFLFTSFHLL